MRNDKISFARPFYILSNFRVEFEELKIYKKKAYEKQALNPNLMGL
jgi:hypothetical protein